MLVCVYVVFFFLVRFAGFLFFFFFFSSRRRHTRLSVDWSSDVCSSDLRGWQPLPRLRLWSRWPLGMFRAWSWLHPDQTVLVWPRPEAAGPPPQALADDPRHMRLHRGEELAALRDYQVGDPQRHIAWKASARHDDLLVKDFEQPRSQPQWQLDWRQLRGMDDESRIARLARWLNEAQSRRCSYSLWLPGNEIGAGNGPLHYARCMDALAGLP